MAFRHPATVSRRESGAETGAAREHDLRVLGRNLHWSSGGLPNDKKVFRPAFPFEPVPKFRLRDVIVEQNVAALEVDTFSGCFSGDST